MKSKISFFLMALFVLVLFSCMSSKYQSEFPANLPNKAQVENIDTVLVMGGGGAKAMAHAGVLSALKAHGVKIDMIVANSAASLVAAVYADNLDINYLKQTFMNTKRSDLINDSTNSLVMRAMLFNSPAKMIQYEKFALKHIQSKNIEDLKMPLVIVVTNLSDNRRMELDVGPIVPAILASSSIPGIFKPIKMYKKTLVDGGVISPVPVLSAKKFSPKKIIAVNITAPPPELSSNSTVDIMYHSYWMTYYELSKVESSLAQVVIHPNTKDFGVLTELSKKDKKRLYQIGYDSTEKLIHKIKNH